LYLTNSSSSENSPTVLKPKTTRDAYIPQGQNQSNTTSVRTAKRFTIAPQNPSDSSALPGASLVGSESVGFEGESSLHAHSIAARNLLEQTLGNHSHVRDDPKMSAALSSLRQIVEADKVDPSQKKSKLTGLGGTRKSIYELKLPPTEVVLDILQKSKRKPNRFLSVPILSICTVAQNP
jgi:hypothetical protein